jgi:hypothetical protein
VEFSGIGFKDNYGNCKGQEGVFILGIILGLRLSAQVFTARAL